MNNKTNRERLAVIENNIIHIQKDTSEIKEMIEKVCDKSEKNTNEIKGLKAIGGFIVTIIGIFLGALFKKL